MGSMHIPITQMKDIHNDFHQITQVEEIQKKIDGKAPCVFVVNTIW